MPTTSPRFGSGSRFAHIRRGPRDDLPRNPRTGTPYSVRSGWEANLLRIAVFAADCWQRLGDNPHAPAIGEDGWCPLDGTGGHLEIDYEYSGRLWFPGIREANNQIFLDFDVWTSTARWPAAGLERNADWFVEGKGGLPHGGWLPQIDLVALRRLDQTSTSKFKKVLRYYPHLAPHVYVVGKREYEMLRQRYARLLPIWEGALPRVARAAESTSARSTTAAETGRPRARRRSTPEPAAAATAPAPSAMSS